MNKARGQTVHRIAQISQWGRDLRARENHRNTDRKTKRPKKTNLHGVVVIRLKGPRLLIEIDSFLPIDKKEEEDEESWELV